MQTPESPEALENDWVTDKVAEVMSLSKDFSSIYGSSPHDTELLDIA